MPTEFYFKIQYFNFEDDYNHISSQSQKHSTVTNQTQISQCENQLGSLDMVINFGKSACLSIRQCCDAVCANSVSISEYFWSNYSMGNQVTISQPQLYVNNH